MLVYSDLINSSVKPAGQLILCSVPRLKKVSEKPQGSRDLNKFEVYLSFDVSSFGRRGYTGRLSRCEQCAL